MTRTELESFLEEIGFRKLGFIRKYYSRWFRNGTVVRIVGHGSNENDYAVISRENPADRNDARFLLGSLCVYDGRLCTAGRHADGTPFRTCLLEPLRRRTNLDMLRESDINEAVRLLSGMCEPAMAPDRIRGWLLEEAR